MEDSVSLFAMLIVTSSSVESGECAWGLTGDSSPDE